MTGLTAATDYQVVVTSYDDSGAPAKESDRPAATSFTTVAAADATPTYDATAAGLSFTDVSTNSITINFNNAAADQKV